MPRTDDPIREEVERALHAIVGATIAAPLTAIQVVQRCVGRRVHRVRRRLGEPVAVVRSLFDLVGGRGPTPVPARKQVPTAAPAATAPPSPPDDHIPGDLPIEEYQSLAASQVVARLPTLTPEELGEVRRFEAAHRGRRTVLGRIDQLLVSS